MPSDFSLRIVASGGCCGQVLSVPMVSPTGDQWQGSPDHTGSDTGGSLDQSQARAGAPR